MLDKVTGRRVATLREMELFRDVPEPELLAILGDLHPREYARDETVFRQGDESHQVFFILKGKVRVYKISPSGSETSIDIFSTHDIIGELAALDSQPRSATGKAITSTSLLVMTQERFLHHMQSVPGLALGLARMLAQKLRWTSAYAESVAQFDAAGRLLHIILLNNERYGEARSDGAFRIDMGLNQSDLASMIGARREWVNRILNDWRRRGLLNFDSGVITVLDLPRVIAERDSRLESNQHDSDW